MDDKPAIAAVAVMRSRFTTGEQIRQGRIVRGIHTEKARIVVCIIRTSRVMCVVANTGCSAL